MVGKTNKNFPRIRDGLASWSLISGIYCIRMNSDKTTCMRNENTTQTGYMDKLAKCSMLVRSHILVPP